MEPVMSVELESETIRQQVIFANDTQIVSTDEVTVSAGRESAQSSAGAEVGLTVILGLSWKPNL